jgi:hypothetical protein
MYTEREQRGTMPGWVYAMVSKKTGAAYIGCTMDMKHRFKTHLAGIVNGNHQLCCIAKHFKNHAADDVRFEILEQSHVNMFRCTNTDGERVWWGDWLLSSRRPLHACERKWMQKYPNVINQRKGMPEPEVIDKTGTQDAPAPTPR